MRGHTGGNILLATSCGGRQGLRLQIHNGPYKKGGLGAEKAALVISDQGTKGGQGQMTAGIQFDSRNAERTQLIEWEKICSNKKKDGRKRAHRTQRGAGKKGLFHQPRKKPRELHVTARKGPIRSSKSLRIKDQSDLLKTLVIRNRVLRETRPGKKGRPEPQGQDL